MQRLTRFSSPVSSANTARSSTSLAAFTLIPFADSSLNSAQASNALGACPPIANDSSSSLSPAASMYNLRRRLARPVGFYKQLSFRQMSARAIVPNRRRRQARSDVAYEAHFVGVVKRFIIEGLKFKARPSLVKKAKIEITQVLHQRLSIFGFDRKWRSGVEWLRNKQLPTQRLDMDGSSIGIMIDTFRIRIAAKRPIYYFDESRSLCKTESAFFCYLKFKNDL